MSTALEHHPTFVTTNEWGVAFLTGDEPGVTRLSVHRLLDEPNEWGGRGRIERHPLDGLRFASVDDATWYAYEHGLLGIWAWSRRATDRLPRPFYLPQPEVTATSAGWEIEPADCEVGIFHDTAWHAACPEAGGAAVAPVESLLGYEGEGHERHARVAYTFTCPGCGDQLTNERLEWAPDDEEEES